jgi:hypothetical protein
MFATITRRAARAALVLALGTLPLAAQGPATGAPATAAAPRAQFTILIFERPGDLARRTGPSADAYWSAYDAFAAALAQAGVLRSGSALAEDVRATVRGQGSADAAVRGARLGGYFVIEAASLDEARRLARQAPAFAVAVEVRPHRDNPHMMKGPGGGAPPR